MDSIVSNAPRRFCKHPKYLVKFRVLFFICRHTHAYLYDVCLTNLHAIIDRFVVRISSSFWLAGWLNQKNCVGWHVFEFFLKINWLEQKWISPVILKRLWITENRTFEAVVRTRRTFLIIIFGGRHRPDSELGISWPYPILLDGHHPADYPMWPN